MGTGYEACEAAGRRQIGKFAHECQIEVLAFMSIIFFGRVLWIIQIV